MESTPNDNLTSDLEPSDLNSTNDNQKPVRLPEPDADNITVLTKELPNDPILPWNRYDSPWLEAEAEEPPSESELSAAEQPESVAEPVHPDLESEPVVSPSDLPDVEKPEALVEQIHLDLDLVPAAKADIVVLKDLEAFAEDLDSGDGQQDSQHDDQCDSQPTESRDKPL